MRMRSHRSVSSRKISRIFCISEEFSNTYGVFTKGKRTKRKRLKNQKLSTLYKSCKGKQRKPLFLCQIPAVQLISFLSFIAIARQIQNPRKHRFLRKRKSPELKKEKKNQQKTVGHKYLPNGYPGYLTSSFRSHYKEYGGEVEFTTISFLPHL